MNSSNPETTTSLVSHFIELRRRIRNSLIVILPIFLSLILFANQIYTYVSAPLTALLPAGTSMIATDIAAPFFAPFKLTLIVSVFLAMPFVLYQLWGFLAPGLYQNEKRLVMPLLISSVLLFYLGIAFAYYVVFPVLFGFFTSAGPANVDVMTDISSYLGFVLKLFFAFGLAFEIPVATLLLIACGISSIASLSAKRPYIVVGCFVIGMLLTPPDPISQSLLAVPMWLLFEIGILMARMLVPQSEENR